jgi:hypothetical protein
MAYSQKLKNVKRVSHCEPVKGHIDQSKGQVEASLSQNKKSGRFDLAVDGNFVYSGPFNLALGVAKNHDVVWDTEPKLEWKHVKI